MPAPFVPTPPSYNVPNVPGVPGLLGDKSTAGSGSISVLTGDAPGLSAQSSAPQWGIFDSSNNPVIIPDSVLEFEFTGEARLSKYPQEQGAFADYNKVQEPSEIHITMTKGGSVSDRTAFLQSLAAAKASLNLYSVATPEEYYSSLNVIHNDFDRKAAAGATLITVTTHLEEVRVTGNATYSTTGNTTIGAPPTGAAQPSGADPTNNGQVQTTNPTAAQATALGQSPNSSPP